MRIEKLEIKVGKTTVTATYSYRGLTKKVKEAVNSEFAKAILRRVKGD